MTKYESEISSELIHKICIYYYCFLLKHVNNVSSHLKLKNKSTTHSGLSKAVSSFLPWQFFRKFKVRASYVSSGVKSPPSLSRKTIQPPKNKKNTITNLNRLTLVNEKNQNIDYSNYYRCFSILF